MGGTLIVGQSGGPTVVINRSLAGAIEEATRSDKIGRILGLVNGIEGERFPYLEVPTEAGPVRRPGVLVL